MTAAPIAVFAFKRPELLARTLRALESASGFAEAPVHIFSDAARPDVPGERDSVAAVRTLIRSWASRHGAIVEEAPSNLGLRRSILGGVSAMLAAHERLIVLEDDILVSRGFLQFTNEALSAFSDRPDIVQVSGYFIPHRRRLEPAGLLRVPACWGWGTWRRAWQHYRDDAAGLAAEIKQRDVGRFDIEGSYGYLDALERNARGEIDTWAVRWYASVFLRGGLTVYPGQSLTRNIGFVPGGTHTGPGRTARAFLRQPIAREAPRVDWETLGSSEDPEFAAALEGFYRWQHWQWVRPSWKERVAARWNLITRRHA
jgi:hypothetical protein